jgi:cellulose synthase/poly-beta-1,6-N-acetylglucosamine synthase-like glycosyltransferase
LALHPWQITGIIIIDVGVLMAVLIGPFLMVWFIPVGIGLLILGKITEKWIQFKWIGISLAITIVIIFLVPFPFSLPIIIGISIWLSINMRKRALNKNRIERKDTTQQSINSPHDNPRFCLQKVVTQYFVDTVEKKEIAQGNFVPYVEGVLMQPLR